MTRVLVCGGRNYADSKRVSEVLSKLHSEEPFEVLIHGRARGADTLARLWAKDNGVPEEGFSAEWKKYGRAAGAIRNTRMLKEGRPTLVVAFPGGKGTTNMVRQAEKAGVPVIEIDRK